MRYLTILPLALLLTTASLVSTPAAAETTGEQPVVNLAEPQAAQRFTPSDAQTTVAAATDKPGALVVTIQPGAVAFPGVAIKPTASFLDFSAFGYVEARLTNLTDKPLVASLRIDNTGGLGSIWINENLKLPANQSGTVRAYLSKTVDGFRADKIAQLLLFTGKVADAPSMIRIDALVTGGKPGDHPPILPADIRTKPTGGTLFSAGTTIDAAKQLAAKGGAECTLADAAIQVTLPASATASASAMFKPTEGCWDLRDALETRVVVRNTGSIAITPQIRLDSTYGPSDVITTKAPLPPGQQAEIVIPFTALQPWKHTPEQEKNPVKASTEPAELQGPFPVPATAGAWGPVPGTGNTFVSGSVKAVTISALPAGQNRSLAISAIKTGMPAPTPMPDWVGKRPPVPGDWVQTFQEEFNGTTLDELKWSATGSNYYDKITHYSRDNAILGGGMLRLRYEKKTGYHNDDPKSYQTDYASGMLDTFDKWVQRYGYFEARVKLPKAPGLWPAFWMMPNRPGTERRAVRGSTNDGGMEFDILEYLSIWGPYRYNIAMHWDGYNADHKSAGTKVYFLPDKDGFVTVGLLWTPGSAIYYANGREVLRFESERVANVPGNLILYMVTGGWDNNHLDAKNPQLPDEFVVDYVRCWQRRDLSSDADTTKVGR